MDILKTLKDVATAGYDALKDALQAGSDAVLSALGALLDAFVTVLQDLLSILIAFLGTLLDVLIWVAAFLGGTVAYLVLKAWNFVFNHDWRRLSATEKSIIEPWFLDVDLDGVKLHENATLLAPPSKVAMALGHDIYWEGSLTICGAEGESQAKTLMHELVHVRQAERSNEYQDTIEYTDAVLSPGNALEKEAEDFVKANKGDLEAQRVAICAGQPAPVVDAGGSYIPDWGWVLDGIG